MPAPPSLLPRGIPSLVLHSVVLPTLALIASQVALLALARGAGEEGLAGRPVSMLLLLALGGVALAFAVRALGAWTRRRPGAALAALVLVGALLRVLALPLAPTLSDDLFRYLWDGRVLGDGENPYAAAPADPRLAPLRDDLYRRVAHREVPTVYPPAALGLFSIAARAPSLGASVATLKGLLALADLAGCALLGLLALRLGLPVERTAWYAWNPLVVLETAGMGHVDALGVAAVVAAVLCLDRSIRAPGGERMRAGVRWATAAGAAAALGVLAKLVPAVALPAWWRRSAPLGRSGLAFAAATAGLLAAAGLPFLVWTGGVPPGLVTYGVAWEFNGPLYEPLWRLLAATGAGDATKAGLDNLKGLSADIGWHGLLNRIYPYAYPQLLAKLLLGTLLSAGVVRSWRQAGRGVSPVRTTGDLFAVVLLASATVYPWYLLWVLPWAALERRRPWLLAAGLAPLTYLPQTVDGIELFPWVWLAVWGPPAALAAAERLRPGARSPAPEGAEEPA